ncbi:MAG: sensor histidine kinase, partial [Clostridiaceae bacterium]|nr:sensor histidine kinase [Clostridiaceae bacterium]
LRDRLSIKKSIRRRITASYMIIIVMMLIPAIVSMTFMSMQSMRYDQLIRNVSDANELNSIVKSDITDEIWEVVAGRKTFAAGRQFEIISDVNDRLDRLMDTAPDTEGRNQLILASRSLNTLTSYVEILGDQISRKAPVSDNMIILEEIRGVVALVQDVLQEYVVIEIDAAASTNEMIKSTTRAMVLVEIGIVLAVFLFSLIAQASVSRNIRRPLEKLQLLAIQIADGDLEARAEIGNVEEIKSLTESLNRMAGKIKALIALNIQEQKNLQKSEMKALQAQITPHFLYNTLDAIIWMAVAGRKDEVVDITKALSNFFRITLSKGRDWIRVCDEVDHVRSYLTIQQIRYRDILEYSIDVDKNANEHLILKLLLQPLVENAIYHGIKGRRAKGSIMVSGWLEDDLMCFCVEDNGIGMDDTRLESVRDMLKTDYTPDSESSGYGIYNVNKRLQLYYGRESTLLIESSPDSGTQVMFKVPCGPPSQNNDNDTNDTEVITDA